jgi:hypothetical protein
MDYGKILRRALEITWRHKALWVFGFALALFSGGGGTGGGQGLQYTMGAGERMELGPLLAVLLFILLFVVVLVVLAVVIGYLSHGALIGMVQEAEETGHTSVRSGWRMGWSRFLPLFGIDLVIGIPAAVVAAILIGLGLSPLLLLITQEDALAVLAILLTAFFMLLVVGVLIIMGVVLSMLRKLAFRQCVLEQKGVIDSIRDGYLTGRQNLRQVGVMWLLLLVINVVVGVVAAPLFFLVFGAVAAPILFTFFATESLAPTLVVGIPIFVLAFLLMTVLGAVYQVFRSTVWTLTYLEL